MSYRSTGSNVMLTALDRTVRVATLAESRVKACFHTLLKLIFFSERTESRFFSISVSDMGSQSSLSIIADADDLADADFAEGDLQLDDTLWQVLLVSEGAMGFESVGVIERITGPLASAAIPVLYLSTVSTDYVLLPVVSAPALTRRALALTCSAGSGPGPLPWRRRSAWPRRTPH